ncbi:MAG: SDR family NAD(P)-dependent oxidoreductase [Sulfurimonas sp.]|nr:SDR family NAD(P)-dependent oxidoreductase [Sulfurimonas sp.]
MKKKIALVTGSSRGIGKAIAGELIQENFIVYITGRNRNDLELTAEELGSNVRMIQGDFTDDAIIQTSIQSIIIAEKSLDLVVANLGSGTSTSGHDVEIQEYKRVFDVNFFSSVSLAHASAKVMQNSGGNIIFIASIAGCEASGLL